MAKNFLALLLAVVFVTATHAVVSLQNGHRFPLGIVLGASDVQCLDESDVGLLRFDNVTETVEICTSSGFVSLGANGTAQVNAELEALRSQLDEIQDDRNETLQVSELNEKMGISNILQARDMCSKHGSYDHSTLQCVCDCDAVRGCWEPLAFCGGCAYGWTGRFCTEDILAPTLELLGDNPLTVEADSVYADPGATAWDNRDLDITDRIVIDDSEVTAGIRTVDSYIVYFTVTDDSGNSTATTRTVVVVDTTPPVLSLASGATVITVEAGDSWSDPAVNIVENTDATVTVSSNSSNINPAAVGTYTVAIDAIDNAGNDAVTFLYTAVIIDTTVPTVELVGPSVLFYPLVDFPTGGAVVPHDLDSVVTTDNSAGSVTVVSDFATAVNATQIGDYSVVYTATDESGNFATISRSVSVRQMGSTCETARIHSEASTTTGLPALTTGPMVLLETYDSDAVRRAYCYFTNGKGYELLVNLDTSDEDARWYGDNEFWESDTEFGDPLNPFARDFKGTSYRSIGWFSKFLIVYHNNDISNVLKNSEYSAVCGLRYSMRDMMRNSTELRITSSKLIGNQDISFSSTNYNSYDEFIETSHNLMVMRQSAYGSELNLNRLATVNKNPITNAHEYSGVGLHHEQGGWGIKAEFNPHEHYCPANHFYGSGTAGSTGRGNYLSVTGTNSNNPIFTSSCPNEGHQWLDYDFALFAVATLPAELYVQSEYSSCQEYYLVHPTMTSGVVSLSPSRSVYCYLRDGYAHDVLLNLDTGDFVRRTYADTAFWTGSSEIGDVNSALTAEYRGSSFYEMSNLRRFMVLFHNGGGTEIATASYNVLCGFESLTLRDMLATLNDVVITGTRAGSSGSLSFASDSFTSDRFVQRTEAIVINDQAAFNSEQNFVRISTTFDSPVVNSHQWGGIGGQHRQGGWAVNYEYHPVEHYCPQNSGVGTIDGNYESVSGQNFVFQSSCTTAGVTWRSYDVAILAVGGFEDSGCCGL